MNALFWKMKRKLCKNKIRLVMAFIAPMGYLLFLHFYQIDIQQINYFFPFLYSNFLTLVLGDVEDIILGEFFLTTSITPKFIWRFKYIFFSTFGTIVGVLYVLLYDIILFHVLGAKIVLGFTWISVILSLFFLALGIISAGMIHYCDFIMWKQLFASVFNIMSLVSPFLFIVVGKAVHIEKISFIAVTIVGVMLIVLSEMINAQVSTEQLLDSIQKLVDGYNNNIIDD